MTSPKRSWARLAIPERAADAAQQTIAVLTCRGVFRRSAPSQNQETIR
jgi:hypothetical protein